MQLQYQIILPTMVRSSMHRLFSQRDKKTRYRCCDEEFAARSSDQLLTRRRERAQWLGRSQAFGPFTSFPAREGMTMQASVVRRSLLVLSATMASITPAMTTRAHMAPSGWVYPLQCCSNRDCRPVHGTGVAEGPEGYVLEETGETIGYQDPRLRDSPDGEFHLCVVGKQASARTICLFVPPRSFWCPRRRELRPLPCRRPA